MVVVIVIRFWIEDVLLFMRNVFGIWGVLFGSI
jgi:hypothetical protein